MPSRNAAILSIVNFSRLPYALLVVLAVCLAVATGYEKLSGSDSAQQCIYHAWWFVVLWGAMAMCAVVHTVRRKLWQRPAVMGIHAALLLILLGSLVTHLTAVEGSMHLRKGQTTDAYLTTSCMVEHIPFSLTLKDYHTEMSEAGGATDYVSQTSHGTISMNRPLAVDGYRFYQMAYDADGAGTTLQVVCDPWGRPITYAGYLLLLCSILIYLINIRTRRARGALLAATAVALLYIALRWQSGAYALPVLRTPWLWVHVSVVMAAYGLMCVMLIRPSRVLLRMAVGLLSIGIFLGAAWADQSWGRYWGWDPKEVWALITLIVYCLPLHAESLPWFKTEQHVALYLRLAFLAVAFTYLGVNLLLGGLHSYGTLPGI